MSDEMFEHVRLRLPLQGSERRESKAFWELTIRNPHLQVTMCDHVCVSVCVHKKSVFICECIHQSQ